MFVIFPAGPRSGTACTTGPGSDPRPTSSVSEITRRSCAIRSFAERSGTTFSSFLAIFIIQNAIGLPIALALDTKLRGHEFYRSTLFLPVIVSLVATAYIWQIILGPNIGMLNPLLVKLGQPDWQRDWLADTFLTFKLIWIVQAWQHIGVPIVIYLAGLQSVPIDLKDSARVDGGNSWQVFRGVTFPMLAPAFTIVTITTFIAMFRAFDIPYVLGGPGGAPDGTTDVLSLVIYREAFGLGGIVGTQYRQGYAVAAGVVMFVFLIVAVSIQAIILRRREVADVTSGTIEIASVATLDRTQAAQRQGHVGQPDGSLPADSGGDLCAPTGRAGVSGLVQVALRLLRQPARPAGQMGMAQLHERLARKRI